MRNTYSLCSLCQQPSRRRFTLSRTPQTAFPRFYATDPARHTFDLTDLVLDLDAPGNKFVRPAKDVEVKQPPQRPVSTRRRVHGLKQAQRNRTTPADFLSLALTFRPSRKAQPTFWEYGHRLAFEAEVDQLKLHEQAKPSQQEMEAMSQQLLSCNDLTELKSIVGHLGASHETRKFILENDSAIAEAIRNCRLAAWAERNPENKATDLPPWQSARTILKFINSLSTLLSFSQLELGPALCEVGLYYAAKSSNVSAMTRYLELIAIKGSPTGFRVANALIRTASRQLQTNFSLSDKLRILTGWEAAGIPDADEIRSPSFASLAQRDLSLYRIYIRALGVLGASEALSYEWSSPAFKDVTTTMILGVIDPFIDAFILAKDPWQALQILRTTKAKLLAGTLEQSDPDSQQQGFDIDLKTRLGIREALLHHYVLHGLPNWDVEEIWQKNRRNLANSKSILRNVKEYRKAEDVSKSVVASEPGDVLQQIEDFLQVDWKECEG